MSSQPSAPLKPPSLDAGSQQRRVSRPKPRLPLSAFSPPNSGTGESFPLPPSPTTTHPKAIIDGNVIVANGDLSLSAWKSEAGQVLGTRAEGVVLSLPGTDLEKVVDQLGSSEFPIPVISLSIPFKLEEKTQSFPSYLSKISTSLSTVFNESTPQGVDSLRWALERGRPVDVDIQAAISDAVLESFEDIISKATSGLTKVPPIVLSNILPPPHDLELPIVKLMNHPTYLAFQSQVAALSLFPDVYIKFLPPSWDAPTPPTPSAEVAEITDTQQKKEWKRRIKMYLGPVMEAFGYQRIIFGSSPCPTSTGSSVARDWYEIARESLAELGVEQEFVDAVFYGNAKKVYGSG
ncbi:hypothetical protein LshimejAT787_0405700 [Lyophyllum shimeji]|uniref:Amidohydrolase-related domain-containing protein n=1 Tax=Lyophyllum shimeji TaxID=47721 RepID=A0A9P3PLA0_LYOSH|nr:hypothetical protein LshimejAT787_0405700 [Lyophyllum shimeji]